MVESTFVINTGSELYGPFNTLEEAVAWGEANEEELGDFYITDLYTPSGARDLRDPEKLGKYLLSLEPPKGLSWAYDHSDGVHQIPNVSGDDSMCRIAVEEYRETLATIAKEE